MLGGNNVNWYRVYGDTVCAQCVYQADIIANMIRGLEHLRVLWANMEKIVKSLPRELRKISESTTSVCFILSEM